MSIVHYDSYTDARAHLKDLLDAAENGRVATIRRDSATTAVVDVERLRHFLALFTPSGAEMIDALSEYADDWQERLLGQRR